MASSFSRRVRKAGEEMELHSILLCRKCGDTGVSVQVHHLPAAVLLCQCFCSLPFFLEGYRKRQQGWDRKSCSLCYGGLSLFPSPWWWCIFKGSFSPLGNKIKCPAWLFFGGDLGMYGSSETRLCVLKLFSHYVLQSEVIALGAVWCHVKLGKHKLA